MNIDLKQLILSYLPDTHYQIIDKVMKNGYYDN